MQNASDNPENTRDYIENEIESIVYNKVMHQYAHRT